MNSQASAVQQKGKPKLENSSDMIEGLRDLTVHIHRGNAAQAETIVTDISKHLQGIILSGDDAVSKQRAQQTLFAIQEVGILLGERDLSGALTAARDAAKEWRLQHSPNENAG
jgi:hypothetical protein